jgi:hypothetical protein
MIGTGILVVVVMLALAAPAFAQESTNFGGKSFGWQDREYYGLSRADSVRQLGGDGDAGAAATSGGDAGAATGGGSTGGNGGESGGDSCSK